MIFSTSPIQDFCARFVIENQPVHGRILRLGAVLDDILSAHDYPEHVATLLGEACLLAVMVGQSLKFDGRLILQAQGSGAVRYVVADYQTSGAVRGFCRFDQEELSNLIKMHQSNFSAIGAKTLLGDGTFVMTLDPADGGERYQGVTPIEGESLSLCAEHFFSQSEQVPTQIRLCVGKVGKSTEPSDAGARWIGGGAMIQAHAGDATRGETREGFRHISAFFATLGEDELMDFSLPVDELLFRLFHEDGVRLYEPVSIVKLCRCDQQKLDDLIANFSQIDQEDMIEADGRVHIRCEYCAKTFFVKPNLP